MARRLRADLRPGRARDLRAGAAPSAQGLLLPLSDPRAPGGRGRAPAARELLERPHPPHGGGRSAALRAVRSGSGARRPRGDRALGPALPARDRARAGAAASERRGLLVALAAAPSLRSFLLPEARHRRRARPLDE